MSPRSAPFRVCCLLAGWLAGSPATPATPERADTVPYGLPGVAEHQPLPLPPASFGHFPAPTLQALWSEDSFGQSQALVRRFPRQLELDRDGGLRVRGQVLALDPDAEALARAAAAGFVAADAPATESLGLRLVVLRPKDGLGTRHALKRLRELDPVGIYAYNNVYLGAAAAPARAQTAGATNPNIPVRNLHVGLVDGGVDAGHPALADTRVVVWGCAGAHVPSAHGTAVASLLAGRAGGEVAGAVLYAADIYCGEPTGGSVVQLVQALDWLASQEVGVMNLSLVGPDNPMLAQAVRRLSARGYVIVSAVGNDGPRSPPLYPAAYAEVIGVTAVDERDRLLPEAVRGPHARFAAPGVRLLAAGPAGDWQRVRGTSFAAPLVARLAAGVLPAPATGAAEAVRTRLLSLAQPGRTPGLVILAKAPTVRPGPAAGAATPPRE